MTGLIIIDFDNFYKQELKLESEYNLGLEFQKLIREIINNYPEIDLINLRLYGGWYNQSSLTNKASILLQLLSNINIFPLLFNNNSRRVNGVIELANSLIQIPELIWKDTFKEKKGIRKVKVRRDRLGAICMSDPLNCPPQIIRRFTKKKTKQCWINNCNIIQRDIIKEMQQKMVDTIMACDVISTCEDATIKVVQVVTDDTDILPSLLIAKSKMGDNQEIKLLIKNPELVLFCEHYLVPYNVIVKQRE